MAKKKKEVRPSDARRLAARMGRQTEALLFALNAGNLVAALGLPCAVVDFTHAEAVPGFVVTIFTVVLWMKLVSFAHCNYDLRRAPQPIRDHWPSPRDFICDSVCISCSQGRPDAPHSSMTTGLPDVGIERHTRASASLCHVPQQIAMTYR